MKILQSKQFIKLAGPKDKINKYKITEPTLKLFIHKYEDLVDWNQIRSKEELQQYIKEELLYNYTLSKIDPESDQNYYLNDIDMNKYIRQNVNNNDPQVQQAIQLYRNNPEESKKKIIDHINEGKQKEFFTWWNYVTEENDVYKSDPAFSFIILNPIFDLSKEGKHTPTIPLNAEALSELYENVNQGKDLNIVKSYRKITSELDKRGLGTVETRGDVSGDGWVRIPSKNNDPENFDINVDKVKRYSCNTGWCIAQDMMARDYLSKGDFWFLIKGGKSVVAIRLDGNSVAEIQGKNNERPYEYWEEIINFLENSNIDYKESSHYKDLYEAVELNIAIDSGDLSVYDDIKEEFEKGYFLSYDLLSRKNKTKEIENYAKIVFLNLLEKDPFRWDQIPEGFKNDKDFYTKAFETAKNIFLKILEKYPASFLDIPEEFKRNQDFMSKYFDLEKKYHLKQLERDISHWIFLDKIFKNDPDFLNRAMEIPSVKEWIEMEKEMEKEKITSFKSNSFNWYKLSQQVELRIPYDKSGGLSVQ